MSEGITIKVLGCGPSGGVPDIVYGWGRCDPNNPKNCRTRSSILVQSAGTNLLVDTSPDLRRQLLNSGESRIDAVFYTHMHGDHTHGINELRGISQAYDKVIPVYGDKETIKDITRRFNYLFDPGVNNKAWYSTRLSDHIIEDNPITIGGIECAWLIQDHGPCNSLGLRIGKFAYTIDMKDISTQNIEALRGIDVWLVECLREEPYGTHVGLSQVLEWVKEVNPKKVFLTNMGPDMDYDSLCKILPQHIVPAYDGFTITL